METTWWRGKSELQDGAGLGIYMQRYDAAGNALGVETLVNTNTTGDQYEPVIVALANGQYVVAWAQAVENGVEDWTVSVMMQRYNAAGALLGGEIAIQTENLGGNAFGGADASYHELDIVQLTGGDLAVSWTRSSFDDGSVAQMSIVTSTGVAVAGPLEPEQTVDQLSTLPQQSIVALGNGNVLILYAYTFDNTGAVNVGYGEVYGRIYDDAGNPVGDEFAIATGTENRRFDLFSSSDGKGGAFVGWVEEGNEAGDRLLMMQQVSDSGALISTPVSAFILEGFQNMRGELALLSDGTVLVAAQTSNLGASSNIIHRFLHDGEDARFSDAGNIVVLANTGEVVAALSGSDTVTGGTGDDIVSGGIGLDTLNGGDGDDILLGGDNIDTINGGFDNDLIFGDSGNDILHGDADDDIIVGGVGNDTIYGDAHNDTLYGFGGIDTIYGGNGDDLIYGFGTGFENTPYGDDIERDLGVSNRLYGGVGDDRITGGRGNDTINGGEDDDVMFGGDSGNHPSGRDLFIASNGNDTSNGSDDIDTIDYTNIGRALTLITIDQVGGPLRYSVSLAAVGIYGVENQTLYDIETIKGSALGDSMTGGQMDDVFNGGTGDDNLTGVSGNDTLNGGTGLDVLSGGTGNDTMNGALDGVRDAFIFHENFASDAANNFEQGIDDLRLGDELWLATHGVLTAAQVVTTFGVANVAGTAITFDFGNGDVLIVRNSAGLDIATFSADILIV